MNSSTINVLCEPQPEGSGLRGLDLLGNAVWNNGTFAHPPVYPGDVVVPENLLSRGPKQVRSVELIEGPVWVWRVVFEWED